mmetsp:Transcript_44581/g.112803  ORF Transcript_44581/g.112803 Transcript_44581/m.112803 type:complete len:245 (+) Transcript_44581:310-1044(+)
METGRTHKRGAECVATDGPHVQKVEPTNHAPGAAKRGRWTSQQAPDCGGAAPSVDDRNGAHLQQQQQQQNLQAQAHAQAQHAQHIAALQAQHRHHGTVPSGSAMHLSTSLPGSQAWNVLNNGHHTAGIIQSQHHTQMAQPAQGHPGVNEGGGLKRSNSAPELWKVQAGLLQPTQAHPGSPQMHLQSQAHQQSQMQQHSIQQQQQQQSLQLLQQQQQQHMLHQQQLLQQQHQHQQQQQNSHPHHP